ncbi:hypothetical protein B4U79_18498 [Dinothrombium tinctorium]|uniref:Uncharacterized protein n=1 Tax=Dinothrombium tinctorium TaxID=1965070 RepID=A0A3S3RNC6_9ACAR|nr:hypothetical protein B4U79_18556 [Dinothrombium tinctorium]RWS02121.1 hypothetical protein B4U79_18523 [Dinothrombium tinctorium]RWS02329.1 hypothetical protein B4U79_18498 [Dinothrombium tinctorium]
MCLSLIDVKHLNFIGNKYCDANDYFFGCSHFKYTLKVNTPENVISLLYKCKHIESISLFGFSNRESLRNLIEAIGDCVEQLKRFTLYYCGIENKHLIKLIEKQPSLEYLRINNGMNTELINYIKTNCLNLRELLFDNSSTFELKPFQQALISYGLFVDDCSSTGTQRLYLLSQTSKKSLKNIAIEVVNSSEKIDFPRCLSTFENLSSIRLSFYEVYEWESYIWRFHFWMKLEIFDLYVNFENGFYFDDSAFLSLAHNCPRLKVLALRWMRFGTEMNESMPLQISDLSLLALSETLKDLRVLHLTQAPYITDQSVISLKKLEKLEQLQLHCCRNVTDNCVATLVQHLQNLCVIGISSRLFFEKTLNAIRAKSDLSPHRKFYALFLHLVSNKWEKQIFDSIANNLMLFSIRDTSLTFYNHPKWCNLFCFAADHINDHFSWKHNVD